MSRQCDVCGTTYTAKRATSRYCGAKCRTRASRAGVSAPVIPVQPRTKLVASVADAVQQDLDAAGVGDTTAGRVALALAALIDEATVATGSAAATLARELRAAMAEALQANSTGAQAPLSIADQLKARRDAKRGA